MYLHEHMHGVHSTLTGSSATESGNENTGITSLVSTEGLTSLAPDVA